MKHYLVSVLITIAVCTALGLTLEYFGINVHPLVGVIIGVVTALTVLKLRREI